VPRTKILSVTLKNCDVQTFRSGGPGGQNQNKRDTGVRIIHRPSGAVGESREHRTQLENKKAAFRRMAESPKFKLWVNREIWTGVKIEDRVKEDMADKNIRVEVRREGLWRPE
jgi:hypothetical protein